MKQKIQSDLTQAMKDKDAVRVSALRMLVSSIHNKEIALLKKDAGLSDEDVLHVIRSEVKKRKEAAEEFEKGGRHEMAESELTEAQILEVYLPAELSDDELHALVKEAIWESGAAGEKDFGKAMKSAQAAVKGRALGERVAEMVRGKLRGNAS
ncbi:MAG: GatB/YqeY domain-containing protein [Patescibacteria group bacterium]